MKKWMILPVLLLLILTACQTVSNNETEPAGSTPSSSHITPPPSSSAVPPTSVPAATTPPTIIRTEDTGYTCIYSEDSRSYWSEYDFSGCITGYLYWLDKETHEVTLLLAEETICRHAEGLFLYYTKQAEPTKIYEMRLADPSQSRLIHETMHGEISYMTIYPGVENYLQFIADNKKFVIFEFNTGNETVLMEQYYIRHGHTGGRNGVLDRGIWFEGKYKETDSPYEQYIYNLDTGETVPDTSL